MVKPWKSYLMEATGLAGFVIIAGLLAIFLEHPDLPVMHSRLKNYPLLRRIPLGVILGIYVGVITLLFGKKSGAHVNPAITFTFFRLGKIKFRHALFYSIAQFAGAIIAAQLLTHFTAGLFSHSSIDFGVTKPKPPYSTATAFIGEFIISFIAMLVLLFAMSSKYFEKYIPLISGLLLGLYLIFEMPFSGMSLNPARSFAAAFAANQWKHLWVYFLAPPLAMLAAAEIFQRWRIKQLAEHRLDYKEIADFPAETKK